MNTRLEERIVGPDTDEDYLSYALLPLPHPANVLWRGRQWKKGVHGGKIGSCPERVSVGSAVDVIG